MMKPNTRFPVNPVGQRQQIQQPPPVPSGGGPNQQPPVQSAQMPAWQQLAARGITGQGSAAANQAALQQQPSSSLSLPPPGISQAYQQAFQRLPQVLPTPPIMDPAQLGHQIDQMNATKPFNLEAAGGAGSSGSVGNIDNAISSLRSQLQTAGANMPGTGGPLSGQTPPWAPPGAGVGGDLNSPGTGAPFGPMGALPGPSGKFPPATMEKPMAFPGGQPYGEPAWGGGPGAPGTGNQQRPSMPGAGPGAPPSYLDLLKQRLQARPGGPSNGVGLGPGRQQQMY